MFGGGYYPITNEGYKDDSANKVPVTSSSSYDYKVSKSTAAQNISLGDLTYSTETKGGAVTGANSHHGTYSGMLKHVHATGQPSASVSWGSTEVNYQFNFTDECRPRNTSISFVMSYTHGMKDSTAPVKFGFDVWDFDWNLVAGGPYWWANGSGVAIYPKSGGSSMVGAGPYSFNTTVPAGNYYFTGYMYIDGEPGWAGGYGQLDYTLKIDAL